MKSRTVVLELLLQREPELLVVQDASQLSRQRVLDAQGFIVRLEREDRRHGLGAGWHVQQRPIRLRRVLPGRLVEPRGRENPSVPRTKAATISRTWTAAPFWPRTGTPGSGHR